MRQASPRWFIYTCTTTFAAIAAVAAIATTMSAINVFEMWLSLLFLFTSADIILMIHDPNYIHPFVVLFVFTSTLITRNCSIRSSLWLLLCDSFCCCCCCCYFISFQMICFRGKSIICFQPVDSILITFRRMAILHSVKLTLYNNQIYIIITW